MRSSAEELADTERWFISRGLPHFIEDYSASRDIFTRALPLLTLVFVFEMFTALNLEWVWWANALAVAGGLALLVGMLAVANVLRHRPALSRPRSVGIVELSLFVLGPAILPLVFGLKGTVSIATVVGNLLLLGIVYIVTSYGVIPTTRWAFTKLWSQLGALARLLTRALPLLLLFITFLFINPDTWQVASNLHGIFFVSTLLLFVIIGSIFVIARLPKEIGKLNEFGDDEAVWCEVHDTPVDRVSLRLPPEELSRRQWGNAGLVVLVGQGIQVLLIALIVALFLIVLGSLCIRPETMAEWISRDPHILYSVPFGNEQLELTEELLAFPRFASFSALYFTVVAMTDATYREEFFREVVVEVRQALAVRVVYLTKLRA